MDEQVRVAPSPNKFPFLTIFLSILTLLLLSSTAFLANQNLQLTKQIAKLSKPSPSPIPSPSPTPVFTFATDATTGWNIYSRIPNFSFQFPKSWTEQPNYSLQSNDKLMTIWIEGDTVGLECLTLTKTLSKNINGEDFVLKFYDGIENANCDTQDEKVIFFLFSVGNKKYSFTFVYSDSNIEASENLFDQILATFKFVEQPTLLSPTQTSTIPANWKPHTFNVYGLTMYAPDDWQSNITDFSESSSSLIKFWKKSSPTIVPIQLSIHSNWDNTGNAQLQPKNFVVGNAISGYRADPPAKDQQTLDRYQTNVYFEYKNKVYIFECVHNWTTDYVNTCNTMLKTLTFTQ